MSNNNIVRINSKSYKLVLKEVGRIQSQGIKSSISEVISNIIISKLGENK